ncbi:MAG: single-stranded-DNA-specific exonuclease RecJ [Bacteroidetes bacterium]|nr:single-stranded-DNA-specific exonuclease RecJ [Bacteroidota bacterium]MBK8146448.1 single-stranded-DNA-specific exonuclease RecJ [Bacteroidota bacterium]MBP6315427.1 single-stranded-DNA-specific exonuclease RecJ [Chitinophagaceae bacterium]
MNKKWTLKNTDGQLANQLQEQLQIHPILCALLVQRGIGDFENARRFFRINSDQLHDPFQMKGMQKAVDRIVDAFAKNEKILIYGDYDVDGTTAVAVVYTFFRELYPHIEFYIPHRFTEGYGVSEKGIQYAIDNDFKLIITLDCGIKSSLLIAKATDYGIDTIVCDHHLPGEEIPAAFAILNPKQKDCPYPYKELCGCGIGYKLISAFAMQNSIDLQKVDKNLDLVATAIAADIVPITGENRTLAVLGLSKVNENPSIPIQALKQVSEMDKEFTITDLVFIIAPRVNAAGRMDDARKAVELFIETDLVKAMVLAKELQVDNEDRRDVDKLTTMEALDLMERIADNQSKRSTVVYQPHWHKGVVGIVASRLIEHHYRPTIVLTQSNGKLSGSARSIKGFNLFEGLTECAAFLENYGGHYFAAGLTLDEKHLIPFSNKFDEVVRNTVPEDMFEPEIEIDAEIHFKDITASFIKILKQFAPHGPDNMKPIFLTKNVNDYKKFSTLIKERHLRFVVYQASSQTINGIGFNLGEKMEVVKSNKPFDMIYHIEENHWNGNVSIQLKVIDIRQSSNAAN